MQLPLKVSKRLSVISFAVYLFNWINFQNVLRCYNDNTLIVCLFTPPSLRPHSRLFQILPQRIQQWHTSPSSAEENNRHVLENIRKEQLTARQKLVQLDLKHKELDALIDRAKHAVIDPDFEVKWDGLILKPLTESG